MFLTFDHLLPVADDDFRPKGGDFFPNGGDFFRNGGTIFSCGGTILSPFNMLFSVRDKLLEQTPSESQKQLGSFFKRPLGFAASLVEEHKQQRPLGFAASLVEELTSPFGSLEQCCFCCSMFFDERRGKAERSLNHMNWANCISLYECAPNQSFTVSG